MDDPARANIDAVMAIARATRDQMGAKRQLRGGAGVCAVIRGLKVEAHGWVRLAGCGLPRAAEGFAGCQLPCISYANAPAHGAIRLCGEARATEALTCQPRANGFESHLFASIHQFDADCAVWPDHPTCRSPDNAGRSRCWPRHDHCAKGLQGTSMHKALRRAAAPCQAVFAVILRASSGGARRTGMVLARYEHTPACSRPSSGWRTP
jgi:hypothetical protein